MKRRVITKTHIIEKKNSAHNQEWSWEEGPELRQFIEQQATNRLHDDIKASK